MSRYPKVYVGADGVPYEAPVYRLTGPVQMDDIYWQEGEELIFGGCPNEAMVPLNAAAEENYCSWLASLPDKGQFKAEDLMQAAWELRPKEGEPTKSFQEFQVAMFRRAQELKGGFGKRPADTLQAKAYRPTHEVPPMSNLNMGSSTGAPPVPQNTRPRTAKNLPQDQRPRHQRPAMGSTPDGINQLPTS